MLHIERLVTTLDGVAETLTPLRRGASLTGCLAALAVLVIVAAGLVLCWPAPLTGAATTLAGLPLAAAAYHAGERLAARRRGTGRGPTSALGAEATASD